MPVIRGKALFYILFVLFFSAGAALAQATVDEQRRQEPGEEYASLAVLSDYLSKAALNNPELEAAFYAWKSALERIPQVGALPDPRFTFAYFIESVETRVGPQRARFSLAQTFPWFGTLPIKESIALEEANALKAQYDAIKLKLFYDVKSAYYEYAYLAQAVRITAEDLELLRYLERVAQVRYAAGALPYSDVLKTQVQIGRLEDRLRTLQDLRRPNMAKLAVAMNMPYDSKLPWPPAVPRMILGIPDEEVLEGISETNPQLKRSGHLEAKEKAGKDLAERQYYPEFTFGIETILTDPAINPNTPDSGKDPVAASLSVNIPLWWERRRAGVREGETRYLAAVKGSESLRQRLLSEMELALYKYRDAQRKIDLYKDTLIPKAEQAFRVTLEAFQAGTRTSLDLVDAEKTLLEFELSYIRALTDQAQRLAELEMLLGKEIPCSIHGVTLPRHAISKD